jgi:DNA replication protein DnaC
MSRPLGPGARVLLWILRVAHFAVHKTLEEFDFDHQRSFTRDLVAHLGALDFYRCQGERHVFGPRGTGKTHLATALGIRACQARHRALPGAAATPRLPAARGSTMWATSPSMPRRPTCSSS